MPDAIKWATRFLGGFWLLDGLLQLQPKMFTPMFVGAVLIPTATAQPEPVRWLLTQGLHLWSTMPMLANLGVAMTQIGIGMALCIPRESWQRTGLWASIGWSLFVWTFGEGLGSVLLPGQSLLTGLPGSALLYAGFSVLIVTYQRNHFTRTLRRGISVLWAVGAGYQARPLFWKAHFLSEMLRKVAATPSPNWVTSPIYLCAHWVNHAPVVANMLLVSVMLVMALWTAASRRPTWRMVLASSVILNAFWWIGMDFGVLGGVGTDPNTAPLFLMAIVTWYWHDLAETRSGQEALMFPSAIPTPKAAAAPLQQKVR